MFLYRLGVSTQTKEQRKISLFVSLDLFTKANMPLQFQMRTKT